MNLLSLAPTDPKTSEQAQALFRKAWAAFPDTRYMLVNRVGRKDVWRMPEMFEYACGGILPEPNTASSIAPYTAFVWSMPLPLSGPINAPQSPPAVMQLLDLAQERGLLDRLLERIEIARKQAPAWKVADTLKVMVLCRAGRLDEARSVFPAAIESAQKDPADLAETYRVLIFWPWDWSWRSIRPLAISLSQPTRRV